MPTSLNALLGARLDRLGQPERSALERYVGSLRLGIIYFLAARNESHTTFVASVPIRFSVPVFFAVFAATGLTAWNILLLTPLDILFAIWTWTALRQDSTDAVPAGARA